MFYTVSTAKSRTTPQARVPRWIPIEEPKRFGFEGVVETEAVEETAPQKKEIPAESEVETAKIFAAMQNITGHRYMRFIKTFSTEVQLAHHKSRQSHLNRLAELIRFKCKWNYGR